MKKEATAARKAAPGKLSRRVSPPPAAPDAAGLFDRVATIPGPAEPKPAAARNRISALSSIVYLASKELSHPKSQPAADELAGPHNLPAMAEESRCPFHSTLSWSHHRALRSVAKPEAREFYESECAAAGWTNRELERQVHSLCYERLLASKYRLHLPSEEELAAEPKREIHMIEEGRV
jgi:hypothetical protein